MWPTWMACLHSRQTLTAHKHNVRLRYTRSSGHRMHPRPAASWPAAAGWYRILTLPDGPSIPIIIILHFCYLFSLNKWHTWALYTWNKVCEAAIQVNCACMLNIEVIIFNTLMISVMKCLNRCAQHMHCVYITWRFFLLFHFFVTTILVVRQYYSGLPKWIHV